MNIFKLPDRVYDILKQITTVVLPACGTLYFALSGIWGFPYGEQIVGTITAVVTFLGVVLGISTYKYNQTPTTEDVLEYADEIDESDYEVEYDLDEETEEGDAE